MPRERRFVARAAIATALFTIALRLFEFKRVLGWAGRARSPEGGAPLSQPDRLAALAKAAAAALPLSSTCLSRALALQWLLGREGFDAQLRIGARLASGTVDAHAWIEWQGRPLGDRAEDLRAFHVLAPQ